METYRAAVAAYRQKEKNGRGKPLPYGFVSCAVVGDGLARPVGFVGCAVVGDGLARPVGLVGCAAVGDGLARPALPHLAYGSAVGAAIR